MKKHLIYYLIFFIAFYACSEKAKNENEMTSKDVPKKENNAMYLRKGNCNEFIANLDFSSFCFTSKKTPKYRLIQNNETNCQYQLYNDLEYQNIDFSIVFADFEKPFGKEVQPELAKNIFINAFQRNKSRRMGKLITGLGDEAYIGYNQSQDNKEQYLGVRVGNVSFTFVFHHGKEISQQSCVSTNVVLEKLGRLVIKNL